MAIEDVEIRKMAKTDLDQVIRLGSGSPELQTDIELPRQ